MARAEMHHHHGLAGPQTAALIALILIFALALALRHLS
jgi:hypothetical protein